MHMLQLHAGQRGDLVVVTHGLLIRTLLAGPLQLDADTASPACTWPTPRSASSTAAPPHALQLAQLHPPP